MPWLLNAAELEAVQHQGQGALHDRMLREIAILLEAMTTGMPLVLVLEDLHWSDVATLDLIAWLAPRRQPAQLMLIGTYRPVEAIVRGHSLKAVKHELLVHRQCTGLRACGPVSAARGRERPKSAGLYEAIGHLIRGVEILNRLPDTPKRARQELDFQASLGLALMLTKGFAASEVGTVNVRAAKLCQQLGEPVQCAVAVATATTPYRTRRDTNRL